MSAAEDEEVVTAIAHMAMWVLDTVETAAETGLDAAAADIYAVMNHEWVTLAPMALIPPMARVVQLLSQATGQTISEIVGQLRSLSADGVDGVEAELAEMRGGQ